MGTGGSRLGRGGALGHLSKAGTASSFHGSEVRALGTFTIAWWGGAGDYGTIARDKKNSPWFHF